LESEQVKLTFPENGELLQIIPCQCFPEINIQGAIKPYGNRVLMIGDSASSKLYKNGIGAAYITARAAANTVIFEGVSEKDFRESYFKICKELNRDNAIGKFLFLLTRIIQNSAILKYGMFLMILKEQVKSGESRHLSSVLWDTFTGSASYRSIFLRLVNPFFLISLLWNIVSANLHRKRFEIYEKQ
jgi:hypothetical protein